MSSPPLIVIRPPEVVIAAPAPPPVVVVAPAPAVTVEVGVPDSYTWDGTEYVGMVGDQYYYLGPDHAWLVFDAPRLARFHDWERTHGDWRNHATHNELYRHNEHVAHDVQHEDQRHEVQDHGHDAGNHHDDKDHGH